MTLISKKQKEYVAKLVRLKREIMTVGESIEEAERIARELEEELGQDCEIDVTYKSAFADLKAIVTERIGYRKIKKKIIAEGLYKSSEIVYTTEQLIRKKGKAKVLIGSLDYNEDIPDTCLKNLEMICGNVDFSKMQDSSKIVNLTTVLGNLVMCDLNTPIKLFFTGDCADLTQVSDYNMLPNYQFAAGNIELSHLPDELNLKYVKGTINVVGGIDISNTYKDMNFAVVYYPNEYTYQKSKIKSNIIN